jgi:hypothetical protein
MAVNIPKIIYNSTTLILTYPQKFWTPESMPIGGSNVSDAGVLEAFVIRRDQFVKVEIRFLESEWSSIDTWLAWAQSGNSFDWYFDSTLSAHYTCYLEDPKPGSGKISPVRDEYAKVMTLKLTLRSTTGTKFTTPIFP